MDLTKVRMQSVDVSTGAAGHGLRRVPGRAGGIPAPHLSPEPLAVTSPASSASAITSVSLMALLWVPREHIDSQDPVAPIPIMKTVRTVNLNSCWGSSQASFFLYFFIYLF